ncbi:MAG TPA: Asd/ArgC dimerization domain-containing protein [Candidatus Acidoferrales bacterium]|nr:Asd/ArgC dimerization domain-containing protein [Candidatus Acidoferrales bacterium]
MPPSENLARVAIVGAASLRGKELKQVLEDRSFPASDVVLLDETIMAGTLTEAAGEPTFVRALDEDSFEGVRFAFFTGTVPIAEATWSAALNAGATVIYLSGSAPANERTIAAIPALRSVIPSLAVQPKAASSRVSFYAPPAPVMIACTVAAALASFSPRRIVLLFFPPVSEHGEMGIEELETQTASLLSFRPIEQAVFGQQVAFNLASEQREGGKPRLGDIRNTIAGDVAQLLQGYAPVPAIQLVQAPVFYGYAFAAFVEFDSAPATERLEAAFGSLGVKIATAADPPPTNISVAGENGIQLGRIQPDPNVAAGVWLWGAADNLRFAATNAVRIAEELLGTPSL